jgi:hypothetical protein
MAMMRVSPHVHSRSFVALQGCGRQGSHSVSVIAVVARGLVAPNVLI